MLDRCARPDENRPLNGICHEHAVLSDALRSLPGSHKRARVEVGHISDEAPPAFATAEEQKIAQLTFGIIRNLESQPKKLPSVTHLQDKDLYVQLVREVSNQYRPTQMELEGVIAKPDVAAIVLKTTQLVIQQTIDIPRILVVPTGEVRSGFKSFTLDVEALNYPAVGEELWIQHLRTSQVEVLALGKGGIEE